MPRKIPPARRYGSRGEVGHHGQSVASSGGVHPPPRPASRASSRIRVIRDDHYQLLPERRGSSISRAPTVIAAAAAATVTTRHLTDEQRSRLEDQRYFVHPHIARLSNDDRALNQLSRRHLQVEAKGSYRCVNPVWSQRLEAYKRLADPVNVAAATAEIADCLQAAMEPKAARAWNPVQDSHSNLITSRAPTVSLRMISKMISASFLKLVATTHGHFAKYKTSYLLPRRNSPSTQSCLATA